MNVRNDKSKLTVTKIKKTNTTNTKSVKALTLHNLLCALTGYCIVVCDHIDIGCYYDVIIFRQVYQKIIFRQMCLSTQSTISQACLCCKAWPMYVCIILKFFFFFSLVVPTAFYYFNFFQGFKDMTHQYHFIYISIIVIFFYTKEKDQQNFFLRTWSLSPPPCFFFLVSWSYSSSFFFSFFHFTI